MVVVVAYWVALLITAIWKLWQYKENCFTRNYLMLIIKATGWAIIIWQRKYQAGKTLASLLDIHIGCEIIAM